MVKGGLHHGLHHGVFMIGCLSSMHGAGAIAAIFLEFQPSISIVKNEDNRMVHVVMGRWGTIRLSEASPTTPTHQRHGSRGVL